MLVCVAFRAFSSAASCGKKSIDAILAINAPLTVTIAIDVNHVAFKSVSKKACPSKVSRWPSDYLHETDCGIVAGVRMGRIPKLVKEKALAECISSTRENEDPSQPSSPARVPSVPTATATTIDVLSGSPSADVNLPLIDEHILFADLHTMVLDHQSNCHTPPPPPTTADSVTHASNCQLPKNFTLDETNRDDFDRRIVTLNRSALTNYMSNCEEKFATDVIEHMKQIVTKIAHPTTSSELSYEQSSFIRHLRWKMFDLCNTYNGRTRQLIERMNSMIHLGVSKRPMTNRLVFLSIRSPTFQVLHRHFKTSGRG